MVALSLSNCPPSGTLRAKDLPPPISGREQSQLFVDLLAELGQAPGSIPSRRRGFRIRIYNSLSYRGTVSK